MLDPADRKAMLYSFLWVCNHRAVSTAFHLARW
eukprot:COSAG02_NODE_1793_length_10918_cov_41.286533_8_plen_33_part_00